ncbi:MAG TPA: dipeptide ABC transporter ATP-binding protein [Dongiaceae bacterium]|jgi:peptide/nickel transport system ATP-binding protein|nr:dipeptide ABC transporter ATP-binding protein [Dongiaceae bacterium]
MSRPSDTAPPPDALAIEGLQVDYRVRGRLRRVLRGIDLRIGRAASYGLVGESGCGKSTAALAAVGYLPRNGVISAGRVLVDGRDLMKLSPAELQKLRATSVSMVYQDPGRALNPSIKIGRQLIEVFEFARIARAEAFERSVAMLKSVRIADPLKVMQRYPHQLSGGMQQRVCIAMALAINPALLILDEPTTGLDVTVEAEVLDLIQQLRDDFQTSILFISHNLAVVAKVCDRVGVLYAGTLVEESTARELFDNPRHPYTAGLLRCLPTRGRRKSDGPLETIHGALPSPGTSIKGCVFADRCPLADDTCRESPPPFFDLGGAHHSRCFYHDRPVPRSAPQTAAAAPAGSDQRDSHPILAVENLSKTFKLKGHALPVLREIDLALAPGETLGLVGESGSGKTTFARLLLGLTPPDTGGKIAMDGRPLEPLLAGRTLNDVKSLQIIFQNPDSALNRSHSVRRIIGRAIHRLSGASGAAIGAKLLELIAAVRVADRYLTSRPRQLSGGLKQRIAIARAFAGEPRVVVCDEPTSALDVSVQAAILNLLVDLQTRRHVSYVFISHDLGVVRYLSDRIAVLYLGRLMEIGPADRVFAGPHHPYTEALLSAIPVIGGGDVERIRLSGEIPSAVDPPSGCVFHTRCPRKIGAICEQQEPPLTKVGARHAIRCHIPVEDLARMQIAVPAPIAETDAIS